MQLQFLTVPETVETIEPYACYDANSLKEVMLNGASVISEYAFQSCDQLEAVTFGDGVQEVQTGAFWIVFPWKVLSCRKQLYKSEIMHSVIKQILRKRERILW